MAFRYINPGYVSLLDSNVTATEITGTTYSKTGTGFSQTNSAAGVTIPQFAQGDDFWVKFDFFVTSGAPYIYFTIPNAKKAVFYLSYGSYVFIYCYYCNLSSDDEIVVANGSVAEMGIKLNAINEVLAHIVLGSSSTAQLDLWINGKHFSKSGIDMLYSESYTKIARLWASSSNVIFSSVIFSNEEISLREKIIALPISSTATDMTLGENGTYIANAANQTLLQTPDVASLITDYGANSTIMGVAVVGNPAYKTGTGITTLKSLSKSSGIITEHDLCNLSEDTLATAFSCWTLENTTIADLQNMQFGWKAGE